MSVVIATWNGAVEESAIDRELRVADKAERADAVVRCLALARPCKPVIVPVARVGTQKRVDQEVGVLRSAVHAVKRQHVAAVHQHIQVRREIERDRHDHFRIGTIAVGPRVPLRLRPGIVLLEKPPGDFRPLRYAMKPSS